MIAYAWKFKLGDCIGDLNFCQGIKKEILRIKFED
jgi:hypothetical protein